MSDSLRPHGLQHTRLPCPSPSPRVYANSCPLSRRCHHNHLILCHLLLLTSILPSTGVFSNESDAMWYGQKKRKTTQRIPSTFFREKKRESLRKCKSTGSKNKLVPPLHAEKVTLPADCQAVGWGNRLASTPGLKWVSKPLSPGLFPAISNYAFPPPTLPTKFTTVRT